MSAPASWRTLAARHLAGPAPSIRHPRLVARVGEDREAARDRLREFTGSVFCPPYVADALSWEHVTGCAGVSNDGKTRVEFDVHVKDAADTAFAQDAIVPVVLRTVAMLNEALEGVANVRRVHITFVAHDRPRLLPVAPREPLMPVHINGGITSGDRVIVHRTEDAVKVTIHELLHLYGYDAALRGDKGVEARLASAFDVRLLSSGVGHLGIGECFIDALACFLHAVHAGAPLARYKKHINVVAARLLMHHAASYDGTRIPPTSEGTHAFMYYVCKAAIWARLDAFLRAHPPGMRPTDTEAFGELLIGLVRAWRPSKQEVALAARSRSMRMGLP